MLQIAGLDDLCGLFQFHNAVILMILQVSIIAGQHSTKSECRGAAILFMSRIWVYGLLLYMRNANSAAFYKP